MKGAIGTLLSLLLLAVLACMVHADGPSLRGANASAHVSRKLANCGNLGYACNTGATCVSGACVCNSGTTWSSALNTCACGTLGYSCNTGASCVSGACVCKSGTTWSAALNTCACGTLGYACNSEANCVSGACVCKTGYVWDNAKAACVSSTTPPTTAKPTPAPTRTPVVPPTTAQDVKGYYDQTWQQRAAPSGTNLGVAFGGWADVDQALTDAQQVYNNLVGSKYLDIGGGDFNGRWTSNSITKLNNGLGKIKSAGYVGVCYDIEEGDAGLSTAFANSFAKAKAAGLKVLVTISHSQPYGFSDALTIMNTVLASVNVDYVSPQLYTSGGETANDWTVDNGAIGWPSYASSKGKIVPSIVKASMYANAQSTFQSYGVTTAGYITWA